MKIYCFQFLGQSYNEFLSQRIIYNNYNICESSNSIFSVLYKIKISYKVKYNTNEIWRKTAYQIYFFYKNTHCLKVGHGFSNFALLIICLWKPNWVNFLYMKVKLTTANTRFSEINFSDAYYRLSSKVSFLLFSGVLWKMHSILEFKLLWRY